MAAKGVVASLGANDIDCQIMGPLDADAIPPQNADVENPGLPVALNDAYVEEGDWDWRDRNGSFDEDMLYRFMGGQSYSIRDMASHRVDMGIDMCMDDEQNI